MVGVEEAATAVPTAVAQCQEAGTQLLYLLVNPTDTVAATVAQATGVCLTDVRMTY